MIPNENYTILKVDANKELDIVYSSVFKILNNVMYFK